MMMRILYTDCKIAVFITSWFREVYMDEGSHFELSDT